MSRSSRPRRSHAPVGAARPAAPGRARWWMPALLVAVFVLKVAFALSLAPHPLLQPEGDLDTGAYWRFAQRVAGGDLLLTDTPFYVSPLYIYWLALAQLVTGASVTGVLVLQAVVGTMAVWLVARTAALWVDDAACLGASAAERAGAAGAGARSPEATPPSAPTWSRRAVADPRARASLVAGGALALTGIVALQEAVVLQSALDAVSMALFAFTATRALLRPTTARWAACGAALALLATNRPNAWMLAGVVALAAWRLGSHASALVFMVTSGTSRESADAISRSTFADHRPGPTPTDREQPTAALALRARAMAALVAGACVVLAPFALRTALATGQWQVLPGHGGLNLYIGNHAAANGTYTVIEGISPSIDGQVSDAQQVASRAEGRHVPADQVSAHFVRRALAWWRDAPVDAARLFLYKLWLTTHAWELPVNVSYAWFREQMWLLRMLPVGAWLLVPLGLAVSIGGHLAVAAARRPAWGWFRWLLPAYLVSVALFFVVDRYRAPALVLGAIHVGVLAGMRGDSPESTRRRGAVLAALAAAVLMAAAFIQLPFQLGEADADTHMAMHAIAAGRDDDADRWLSRAVSRHTAPGVAWFRAGLGWQSRNELARAERAFREAHRLDPDVADVTYALAGVLLQQGKGAEALPLLKSIEAAPAAGDTPRAWAQNLRLDVALAHWQAGDPHLARETLRGRVPPQARPLLRARAIAAVEARRVDVADWLLEEYRRYVRDDAEVSEKLGLMKARLGDADEAASLFEEAGRLDPARATARFNLAVLRAQQGRRDEAVALLREALRIDPTYAQAAGALQELVAPR